jgi:hypothetical protein
VDKIVNEEVLENSDKIRLYTIPINSAEDLAKEIARMANLSMALGYRLEDENRLLTKREAYQQLGHSASLFGAVFEYAKKLMENSTGPKQFGPDHRWDAEPEKDISFPSVREGRRITSTRFAHNDSSELASRYPMKSQTRADL